MAGLILDSLRCWERCLRHCSSNQRSEVEWLAPLAGERSCSERKDQACRAQRPSHTVPILAVACVPGATASACLSASSTHSTIGASSPPGPSLHSSCLFDSLGSLRSHLISFELDFDAFSVYYLSGSYFIDKGFEEKCFWIRHSSNWIIIYHLKGDQNSLLKFLK